MRFLPLSFVFLSILLPPSYRFSSLIHSLAGKVLLPGILCDLSISRWHLDLVVRFGRLVSARIGTFQKSFNLISCLRVNGGELGGRLAFKTEHGAG
jgi:hypothetical protein